MQNRLIFNAELYKWNHSSISCLMLGNVLVLHRESRLCPCFDDLRTEHFTSPNSKHYRDKNIPTTAGRTSRRCDRAMLARPRQGAAPSRRGPGRLAPGGVFASTALHPTWVFRSHTLQEYLEVPGFTWKQCCFISEGDIPGSVHDAPCSAPTALCRGATAPSHCHGNRGVPLYSGAEQPLGWTRGRKAANSHAWADDKTRVGSAPSGLH